MRSWGPARRGTTAAPLAENPVRSSAEAQTTSPSAGGSRDLDHRGRGHAANVCEPPASIRTTPISHWSAPRASTPPAPATLKVDGALTMGASGRLEIPLTGSLPGEYEITLVNGQVVLEALNDGVPDG